MSKRKRIKLFDYEGADIIFFGILALLALWLFVPGLMPGQMMLPFPDDIYANGDPGYDIPYDEAFPVGADVNLEFQPWNDYACERLKGGDIPFWNPYNLCGTPFFANSLNQLTYIPRLIYSLILPPENVLSALALLHFLLAGIGFYYLLRAFDITPIPSGIATFALLFKFSHPTVMMMPPQALTLAFAPICLLLTIKLLRGGRWLFVLYLAICLSCVISSGYPVFAAHFFYLGLAVAIFEYLNPLNASWEDKKKGLSKVIWAGISAVVFSMAQLLPLIQFYLLSARPPLTRELVSHFQLGIAHIGFFLYQNLLFQNPPQGGIPSPVQNLGNLYLGLIPILLVLPLYGQWHNRTYKFFFIATLIAAVINFSNLAFHATLKLIPGFALSPVPPLPLFFFCLFVAFGMTLNHLLRMRVTPSRLNTGLIFAVVIVAGITPLFYKALQADPEVFIKNYTAFLFTSGLFLITLMLLIFKRYKKLFITALLLLLAFNMLPLMKGWTTFFGAENSLGLRLQNTQGKDDYKLGEPRYFDATGTSFMAANVNIYPRIRMVQGYDSLVLKHFVDEYAKHIPKGVKRGRRLINEPGEAPIDLLQETGVGKVILNPRVNPDGKRENLDGIEIYVNEVPFSECVFLGSRCEITRVSPEKIKALTNASAVSDLVIAETFYPGWRYRYVDGVISRPVRRSENGFLMIYNIPKGINEIEIYYHPRLERIGFAIAAIGFIIGLGISHHQDRKIPSR